MAGAARRRRRHRRAALLGHTERATVEVPLDQLGAAFAIVVWVLASAAFGFYVANFSNYNATYGSLAGAVVFLLWLWITNLALLFGAELDAELERGRELQAGIPAEESVQLPLRDDRNLDKARAKRADDIERGRRLRRSRGSSDTPDA